MRHNEESLPQYNYFDPEVNPAFKSYIESFENEKIAKKKLKRLISINDRAYAVQKIFSLHSSKHYGSETLFTAVNIMDRYLTSIGHWNYPRMELCLLATTSIILAAKMDEKYAPSINYTLEFLTDDERKMIDNEAVFDLEAKVLIKLGFDLHLPGPVAPMDRFLQLLGFNKSKLMVNMTYQICKFAMNEPGFLNYTPSIIAGCAVVICANIYMRDKESYESTGVFKNGKIPSSNTTSFFRLSSNLSGSNQHA